MTPKVGGGASSAQVAGLEQQIQELKLQTDTLDKERDFYFTKLRDIEMLLQARPESADNPLAQDILKILYASEDEKVTVQTDGGLTIVGPNGVTAVEQSPAQEPVPDAEME